MGKRKYPPISVHTTMSGTLKVNWERDYRGEYQCPRCGKDQLVRIRHWQSSACKFRLDCQNCGEYTCLSCPVPAQIFRYLSKVTCPNPLCTGLGPHGQRGWIYQISSVNSPCRCYFCGISFSPTSNQRCSWSSELQGRELQPFHFDEDTWDLHHFYDKPYNQSLSFEDIQPDWYRQQVKRYLHHLLKTLTYSATSRIQTLRAVLSQFGQIVQQSSLCQPADISREAVLSLIDSYTELASRTLYQKLIDLKLFLEWLGLDAHTLVKQRDIPKIRFDDPAWLDEPIRAAIREHLHKIPSPIARHYLVQEFIAARPGDVCQLPFDCLVEENGRWYIKFFQNKVKRWHKIPATREIRHVVEEQQLWIRQILGGEYVYLFCHFRSIRTASYPTFTNIKPLPKSPAPDAKRNSMVRIIRCLIEAEDIRDTNGQRPHFTGKITRSSRLQEVRGKHGIEAAQLYADHTRSATTFQYYAPPTREQIAQVDLSFQELLLNPDNRFLPWQSLPESLLENPKAHELDIEINSRLVVYGYCGLDPKIPCPHNLYPKCYGCSSFRPSTGKLPLYERQYAGEQQRMQEAKKARAELAHEEAKATLEAMDKWLPELRRLTND